MSLPLLFIIVLNNGHRSDTFTCLDSLAQNDYGNAKIILVDNVSVDDGSIETIRRRYPRVQIILLTENLGYAGNNNVGIKAALEQGADWILILNDDTVLDPTCLSSLVEVAGSDPAAGIVGPMVYHFDEPHVIQSAGGMLGKYWQSIHLGQNEFDEGQFNAVRQVQWISGCAIMVRRAVIEQVGMLDAEYFLYWEETEWCIRAGRAGWKIFHAPHAKLWHKGVDRNYQPKPYVTYYVTRNHLLTLSKHDAPFIIRISALARVFQTLLSWSIRPKWRSKGEHRNAMWRGLIDFLRHRTGPMPS
jgi:GT2 family glycosyltransferase